MHSFPRNQSWSNHPLSKSSSLFFFFFSFYSQEFMASPLPCAFTRPGSVLSYFSVSVGVLPLQRCAPAAGPFGTRSVRLRKGAQKRSCAGGSSFTPTRALVAAILCARASLEPQGRTAKTFSFTHHTYFSFISITRCDWGNLEEEREYKTKTI